MLKRNGWIYVLVAAALLAILASSAFAAPPVVKTVRVLASNPAIPHDVVSGVATRLKGTSDVQGANIQYTWSFGDGSASVSGTVSNGYIIEAVHTYTGSVGSAFVARLTVKNTTTLEEAFATYNVVIEPDVLATRVNMAIDEGLWYLHKNMVRTTTSGIPTGYWNGGNVGSSNYSNDAVNVNAFEVNGFLQTGPAEDPYTETVSRSLNMLFTRLAATAADTSETNPQGTFNPDADGNGLFVYLNQSYPFYQGGPVVDALVASGTPNAIAALGPANIIGRTYKAIVQDMVDYFAWGQYDGSSGGGWRYNANEAPDNSVCQWVAIGVIAAERQWGILINPIVKTWNSVWLTYSQHDSGYFGYTNSNPVWGPYAVTPSGMVQLAMDGFGRGDARWNKAETFMRDNFGNAGGGGNSVKDYYYGLFSFTKSMLLHDSNHDGVAEPITMLHSNTAGVSDIDWYWAEISKGDPTDGVARTIVNDQNGTGYWFGNYYGSSAQGYFETAWAIIMLRRTVVELPPVAVADAFPNPALAGLPVNFDGSGSYHTNAGVRNIVKWEWDLDNNGTFEALGVTASRTFPADGNYTVVLRVTDDSPNPLTDTDSIVIVVKQPPIAPSSNAGGPYNFCQNKTPWFLDGSGSVNPDEGVSEPGQPANTIIEYAWELDGDNDFNDAFGVMPNITGLLGDGQYLIQLRVTDNSAVSHPSFPPGGQPTNLSDIDTAQLRIRAADDPLCSCVGDLLARAKPTKADLTWTWRAGAHHYNVYRGTLSGGPYLKIGSVMAPSQIAGFSKGVYADFGLTNGVTYYYVVREAAANNEELCQSNQTSARPLAR